MRRTRPSMPGLSASVLEASCRIAAINMRAYEPREGPVLREELLPAMRKLVADVRGVLREAYALCAAEEPECDSEPLAALPFERRIDSLLVAASAARSVVADVAFVAELELSQRALLLDALPPFADAPEILCLCDGALRRSRKSVDALEQALASLEGRDPNVAYESELGISLRVRVRYAAFRAAILKGDVTDLDSLVLRLRAAGTQIAMLIGHDVYPDLRIADRLALRRLQARLLAWLRTPEPRPFAAGRAIWQDLESFVRMLSLVNKRQELLAHDRDVLSQLMRRPGADANTLRHELSRLRGLDEELDTLLDHGEKLAPDHLMDLAARLHAELVPTSPEWC